MVFYKQRKRILKIQLLSDLHCEFDKYKWNIPETDCDLIVLAGDIGNGLWGIEWAIRQSQKLKKPIFFIFGNHDYYYNDLSVLDEAKDYVKNTNVRVLEKDVIEFEGYNIAGCSLWTDYQLYGLTGKVLSMHTAPKFMADHSQIKNANGSKFKPEDALRLHEESIHWLATQLYNLDDVIVITHHTPLAQTIGPEYRGDILSPCFANDFEELIHATQPLLWMSGHTHHNTDILIGDTRVISNQKGYKSENVTGFNPSLIIEV